MAMRVAIAGLGLIGGSLGLALKKGGWRGAEIVGYVRRSETGQRALKSGAVDRFELSLKRAVLDTDVVVVATPIQAIKEIFAQIAAHLPDGCIVTDTASTKFHVMQWAHELLPPRVSFVGGHPMAGKETFGIGAADADLFHTSVYCLVQNKQAAHSAMLVVKEMVDAIGATPMYLDAQEHDNLVAGISHLPLLLSVALTLVTTQSSSWLPMSHLASSGYRDLTRLASGNPEINTGICLSNKAAVVHWIDAFTKELRGLREMVSKGDDEIQRILTMASEARRKWLEKH